MKLCTRSKDGRHNFAVAGMNCMNGCGTNQNNISGRIAHVKEQSALQKLKERDGVNVDNPVS